MRSRIKNFISDTVLLLRSVPSPIVSLFVLSVVLMNLLANKTIYQRGFLAVDGGIVVSWLTFLCMDIITKRFGARAATQVSVFALAVNLLAVFVTLLSSGYVSALFLLALMLVWILPVAVVSLFLRF